MKKSDLRTLIKEEIKAALTLEEANPNTKFEELVSQLEEMALNGEITNDDIRDVASRLQTARRKMFSNKRSPEERKAAATKGATTRKLDNVFQQVAGQVFKDYGLDGVQKASDQFALETGMHKDAGLQKKFNADMKTRFTKAALAQGFDEEAIKRFLETQLFHALKEDIY